MRWNLRPLRLSQQLFLAFMIVLVVVGSLVGWNLHATNRLTAEQRVIIETALPAVRVEVMIRDAVLALRRLEARYAVLRDPVYLKLIRERVQAMESDFLRLEQFLSSGEEKATVRTARSHLTEYHKRVEAGRMASGTARLLDQLDGALEQLYSQSEVELRRREATAQALNEKTRLIAFAGLIASVLIGVSVSAFAALRIARPLRRLQAATQDVAKRAFDGAIPVRGRNEVAELTIAFNQMAAKLRELDQMKEEFFSAISHEFRTPLTAIGMSAELLHGGLPGPLTEKQARLVELMKGGSSRLLGLVNQILDLGKLKEGKLPIQLDQIDLARVIDGALEEIRPLAQQGELQLEVAISDKIPKIQADGQRIHQVLVNLLGNSVKFTPRGGTITVSAELGSDEVIVNVKDTGSGIPAHLLTKIFDRYYQVDKGQGGTGIGLAFVKALVDAHRGRIWADSTEGKGSCFSFTLPIDAQAE
jgi:signal transduction histidine kinase